MSRFTTFLALITLSLRALSQTFPEEGKVINYRIVGFKTPPQAADSCMIEIAAGNFNSADSFSKAIIKTARAKVRKCIVELPGFGQQYTWRTVSRGRTKTVRSKLFHFSTGICPEVDTQAFRLRVTTDATAHADGYILADCNRTIYDMTGKPVWYLPAYGELSGFDDTRRHHNIMSGMSLLDLKLSPGGTITFIMRNEAYEVSYNGEILWKAPPDVFAGSTDYMQYHHEFTRLSNGNYMVLAFETALIRKNWQPGAGDKLITDAALIENEKDDTSYIKKMFSVLVEYAPSGKLVWCWKSSKYFASSDIPARDEELSSADFGMHDNAFCFDEQNKVVYISMKSCSRIVKIEYPSGNVLDAYGETFEPGVPEKRNGPFVGQHACKKFKNGLLYVFNNNVLRDTGSIPEVAAFSEPADAHGALLKAWRYKWTREDSMNMKTERISFQSSGNVEELGSGDVFIYVPGALGKLLIVNPKNEILWSAVSERWDDVQKKWLPLGNYRTSYCTRSELESLIWHEANGQTIVTATEKPHIHVSTE